MKSLVIRNLHVSVEGKEILKGVNLTVNENEVHALMGPNGNGKSTLLAAVMGNPKYTVTEGTIEYDGKELISNISLRTVNYYSNRDFYTKIKEDIRKTTIILNEYINFINNHQF